MWFFKRLLPLQLLYYYQWTAMVLNIKTTFIYWGKWCTTYLCLAQYVNLWGLSINLSRKLELVLKALPELKKRKSRSSLAKSGLNITEKCAMARSKDIRRTIVDTHQAGKAYKTISKEWIPPGDCQGELEAIHHHCYPPQEWSTNNPNHTKRKLCNSQG